MLRLKLNQNSIKIVSICKNRVRVSCGYLLPESDEREFEARLLNQPFILSARVNKFAKSVIVKLSGSTDELIEFLESNRPKDSYYDKDTPSKAQIYQSAVILALTPILKNGPLLAGVSLLGSLPLLKEGLEEFKENGIKSSRMLEALAVAVSLARRDYITANGTNLLLSVGDFMEQSTVYKSNDLIRALAKPIIDEVWVEKHKNDLTELVKIPYKSLKKGDIVVVSTGENIAIDGYIIDGEASVNQVSMTGEAEPVAKQRGDRVMSGTVVSEGRIKIWAEIVGDATTTSRIKEYISHSIDEKSATTLKATKLADKLVPITLSLAGFSYIFNQNMTSVASVLQADYSCALKLATPTAFKTTISTAGKNGIMVKGAKSIEALHKADTFLFDKTGTLTHGKLSVTHICSFISDISDRDLLNMTASAEEHYFHPVAQAIVQAAQQRGFTHIHHDEVEFIVAHGVKTKINNQEVIIGNRHFLEDDEKIDFSLYESQIQKSLKDAQMILYIGCNGKLIGAIGMKDEIRENSAAMIQKLKSLGAKEIIMLTGDVESKAKEVSKELGVDRYYSECLPTMKAEIIASLKKQGRVVAFIGDGINDAPSLSKADIGISMQRGADIAKAAADISLLKDDIYQVAIIKELANKTMAKVEQNFNVAVGLNSLILGSATLGKLSPIQTAFLHNGTTIGLLLNSMKGVE